LKNENSPNDADKTGKKRTQKPQNFLVTGIGASAGGVEALTGFFAHVPKDSGVAYVVILHLSPEHDSELTAILGNVAVIPVTQVIKKVKVEPNHVYVIPPNQHLEMLDGHIIVSPNLTTQDRRAPVDIFFRTLAESHGARAVGVILSGTGANGSMGIKRIKERGGVAFVQNPREALYNEMPRNAIATELIDDILAVSVIPARIISYKQSLGNVSIPEPLTESNEGSQQALRTIFTQLRVRTGHDFSNYKRPTLLRRIERRINIRNLTNLEAYAEFLVENPDEAQGLLKDLLISVTNFFRDKKPFEALERDILPRIFFEKKGGHSVRIWVPGCATGEEAYSIAILCAERVLAMIDPPKVQIFATDIDEAAISIAREGLYTINDAADVSPERLQRFFTMEGQQYLVRREIREMIIFAPHNVLKDPPFSHLDMASCRNMLIYLNSTAQEQVMETLHFALKPGGFLFLGTSESVDGTNDSYTLVSRENHIYQSQSIGRRHIPVSEPIPANKPEHKRGIDIQNTKDNRSQERITYGDLHQQLLEQYAPPSIVVNTEYDILHLSERAGRYLQVAGGELSRNLLKLIRPELRLELRTAFYQATQRNMPIEARSLKITIEERPETINIQVRPVLREGDATSGFLLVLFEQSNEDIEQRAYTSDEPLARQLEEELIRVKSQLRASSDQYEIQAEELKATNEELQAMNEELRSAAEELETSKEELQSINEELRTVNQELKIKIEEVSLTSNNLQNLINSANIGTIFLDRTFRVMLYTPAALEIFNLIPSDYSRALSDITNRLREDSLIEDAQAVLDKLSVIEREMTLQDGRVFFVRFSPYRTKEDRIQGVVITFLEITARKSIEESLQKAHIRMYQAMEAGKIFSWEMNPETRSVEWSDNMEAVIGFRLEKNIDKNFRLIHPDDLDLTVDGINKTLETGVHYASEYRLINPSNGEETWFSSSGALSRNEVDGHPRLVGTTQNINERKKADEALRSSEEKYRTLFNSIDEGYYLLEVIFDTHGQPVDILYIDANPAAIKMSGEDRRGKRLSEVGNYEPYWYELYGRVAKTGVSERTEQFSGSAGMWVDTFTFKVNEHGNRVATVFQDTTERKRQEVNQAFLTDVTEVFAQASSIEDIMKSVGAKIAAYMNVGSCIFADVDETQQKQITARYGWISPGLPSIIGNSYRIEEYLSPEFERAARAGEISVVDNTQDDPRTDATGFEQVGIGSFVILPFHRDGQWRHYLTIYDTAARNWREKEIELLKELSNRIFPRLEQARAKEALLESEQRFRLMVDTVPQMVWITDPEGNVEFFNKRYYEYSGMGVSPTPTTASEVAVNVVHPDDAPKVMAAFEEARAQGIGFEIEQRNRSASGEYRWFLNRAEPYRDPRSGAITRWFGVSVDIHDRKQAQQAMQENEARFRTLSDAVPQIIWTNEANGKASYFNERWYDYSGLDYEQSVGLGWEAIVHPEDAPASVERWHRALAVGEIFDTEYRLRNKDGRYCWFIGRNVPLRNEAGEVTGWFGSATDIEELKEVQEALHESRERLRVTVESATEFAIITFNTAGLVEGWNSGAARIFGYTEAEMLGQPANIIFIPEDRDAGIPGLEFKEAREKGSATDERWHLRRNGERFYMSGVMAPIYDGSLTGYVKVARDMTKQKQSEEALAISEERYRVALQSAEMGAWDWNVIEDKILWNDQHYRLVGLEPETSELNAAFFMRFIHPDDFSAVSNEITQALDSGLYEMVAFRIVSASKETRWMSGYGRVIEWQDGMASRMVGVMYDITERVAAEQELRDKQLQLEIAQRAARVGIWAYDLKNRQGMATPELLELTGYPHQGATWELDIFLKMVHKQDRAGVRDAYRKAATEHSGIELEFRMEHPQRGKQWMLMRGQYIPPYDKVNASLMGSLIDITERKLFEEQKDAFIGIASHELRTPVTSIKAYAEVLEEIFEEAGDTHSAELMRKLDGQVDRLTELIHALLDTTSIVDGRMQLHISTFSIDRLIEESADAMIPANGTHRIELDLAANAEINADRERIRQVLINLMGNAIKYSPNADSIKVSTRIDAEKVIICVQDYGIGISEEVQHKIFDRFYRSGDAQTSTFSGLGLGLFISAGIIHNHNGSIDVTSKKGDGAVFCFTLPYNMKS
jgi:two-component system CheB/CheR fusion protein